MSQSHLSAIMRERRWIHVLAAARLFCVGLVATACSSNPDPNEDQRASARQAINGPAAFCDANNRCTVSWKTPAGIPLSQTAISSSSSVRVNDRATVIPFDQTNAPLTPVIASLGYTPDSRLGVDATVGHWFNQGQLTLQLSDNSTVMGDLVYASPLSIGNGVSIVGSLQKVSSIVTTTVPLLTVKWPTTLQAKGIEVTSGTGSATAGNYYPSITIRGGATLPLDTGDYFTDTLDIESQGKIVANTVNGNVRLFVGGTVLLHGQVSENQGNSTYPTKILIGYLGNSTVSVEDVFNGLLIAPNAQILIQGDVNGKSVTHHGAFFGGYVELHQDATLKAGYDPRLNENPNDPALAEDPGTESLEKYVDKLGFLDGSDCSSWPQTLTPSNYVSTLMNNLGDSSRTADVAWLNNQLSTQGINQITAIGSPRELVIASYMEPSAVDFEPSRRWVALDPSAGTAYDLSYQRLCTVDDLNTTNGCTRRWKTFTINAIPGLSTTAKYEVLGLTNQRERTIASLLDPPKTVMLVAPKVHFQVAQGSELPYKVDLNVNLIVAADQVLGGTPEGTTVTGQLSSIEVKPYSPPIAQNWQADLVEAPKPGLLAVFADQISGVGMLSSYAGVRISRVNFYDGQTNYSDGSTITASTYETIWRYLDTYTGVGGGTDTTYSYQLNLPKSAAFNWTVSNVPSTSVTSPSAMPAWWCSEFAPLKAGSLNAYVCNPNANQIKYGTYGLTLTDNKLTYNITTTAPSGLRKTPTPLVSAALLSTNLETPSVVVRAPAVPPTSILTSSYQASTKYNIGTQVLSSTNPTRWSYYALETETTNPTKYYDYVVPVPNNASAISPVGQGSAWLFTYSDPGIPMCGAPITTQNPFPVGPDPSDLAYNQFIYNYQTGPMGGAGSYFITVVLKCRDIVPPFFKRDDGTQSQATATAMGPASTALTSFINAEVAANWMSQSKPATNENTHFSLNGALAHAGAQIISNGLYFSTLYAHDDTASLAQSTPVADYPHLSALLDDIDPNATGTVGINAATQAKVRTIAATLDPSFTGIPLNALGLPYGNFAAPWVPVWAQSTSQTPPLALSDITTRWQELSNQQTYLQYALDTSSANALLDKAITYMQDVASKVQTYAQTMSTTDTVAFANQTDAYDMLTGLLDQIKTDEQGYVTALCQATTTTCPPNDVSGSMSAVAAQVTATASSISAACPKAPGALGFLDDIAKAMPYIGTAATAFGALADQVKSAGNGQGSVFNVVSLVISGYMNPTPYKLGAANIATAASIMKGIGTAADLVTKADSALNQILPQMGQLSQQCDTSSGSWGAVQSLLMNIATANTLLDTMNIQATTVQSLSSSIQSTLEYLAGEGVANLQLASDLDFSNPNSSTAGLLTQGKDIAVSQNIRAKFIQAACFTVRNAVREGSKDLYAVSALLQTSAGRSQTLPGLVIPAEDLTFGQSPAPKDDTTSYQFVTNIWDTKGFTSAFDQSGNPNSTSYIEAATSRFSDLILNEMCRTSGATDRPSTLSVVRHVLTSQELTNLSTQGYTNFNVGMAELAESASNSIDLHIAGVVAQDFVSQKWDVPLSAPVVLGARYATCAKADCSTPSSISLGNTLDLIRSRDAWVPRACNAGENPLEVTISGTGKQLQTTSYVATVDTCTQQVRTPPVYQAVNFLDTTLNVNMNQQLGAELTGAGQLCHVLPSNQLLEGVIGTPLMGTWTLGDQSLATALLNVWTAGSVNTTPISLPAPGLEVLFFVGAEPKPQNAPPAYVTTPL